MRNNVNLRSLFGEALTLRRLGWLGGWWILGWRLRRRTLRVGRELKDRGIWRSFRAVRDVGFDDDVESLLYFPRS